MEKKLTMARHFVDVEMDRILTKSIERLERVVGGSTAEQTLGELVGNMTRELRLTCSTLEQAIEPFMEIRMNELD